MILFLTGNTFRDRTGCEDKSEMIPDNHLIDEMQKMFPDPCRALYFSDGPDDFEFNDFIANDTKDGFEYKRADSGSEFHHSRRRTHAVAESLFQGYRAW